jgi:hypothetical protein
MGCHSSKLHSDYDYAPPMRQTRRSKRRDIGSGGVHHGAYGFGGGGGAGIFGGFGGDGGGGGGGC